MTIAKISGDLADLQSETPKVKYRAARRLVATARKDPAVLYPHLDFFANLLACENQILKWTAIDVVGCLIASRQSEKTGQLLKQLRDFLCAGKLITAAHAISALSGIACARPEYRTNIARALLKVENYEYDTVECRNIALGKVIITLASFYGDLDTKEKQSVRAFAERQLENRRHATRVKAARFLKKINKQIRFTAKP